MAAKKSTSKATPAANTASAAAPTSAEQAALAAAAAPGEQQGNLPPGSSNPESDVSGQPLSTPDQEPAVVEAAAPISDLNCGDDGDIEGLWITAVPAGGFRRCGFSFTREGVGIALSALTPEQIEQLENEPNLKVERGIFSGRVEVQE